MHCIYHSDTQSISPASERISSDWCRS